MSKEQQLRKLLDERILILDGAMGSLIQVYMLDEAGFRGERFSDHAYDVKGNNDLLNMTQQDIIRAIYLAYLDAGADLVTTNTFNANAISQADYHLSEYAYEMNLNAARLAREAGEVGGDVISGGGTGTRTSPSAASAQPADMRSGIFMNSKTHTRALGYSTR